MDYQIEKSSIKHHLNWFSENWFFYWKTSAGFWENHLLQFPDSEIIFIPLFWGFHYEEGVGWDFGHVGPERDLVKLIQLLKKHSKRYCFLLPLSPAPFMVNGGIPTIAAKIMAIGHNGVSLGVLDAEEKFNRMFSFFEPKVFQVFHDFCKIFNKILEDHKLSISIYGVNFTFFENQHEYSYFEDQSLAFNQGFSRYLKKLKGESIVLDSFSEEDSLKSKYTEEVQLLFESCAASCITGWRGIQKISLLAGSLKDSLQRSLKSNLTPVHLMKQMEEAFSRGRWISSSLIDLSDKQKIPFQYLTDRLSSREIENDFLVEKSDVFSANEWRFLELILLFDSPQMSFAQQGLTYFLKTHFNWCFKTCEGLKFGSDWIDKNHDKIKFFQTTNMDKISFSHMLKLFLMGQRIVVDTGNLSQELKARLDIFFVENNLKIQKVNFITELTLCELGEGLIILYNGSLLNLENSQNFWKKIFEFLSVSHLGLTQEENIFGFWKVRGATSSELNYLDVRRLSLYNPTSYKKYLTINIKNGFAFMRVIDPNLAQAKSISHKIDIELLPQGRIALDFGHYQEDL